MAYKTSTLLCLQTHDITAQDLFWLDLRNQAVMCHNTMQQFLSRTLFHPP